MPHDEVVLEGCRYSVAGILVGGWSGTGGGTPAFFLSERNQYSIK